MNAHLQGQLDTLEAAIDGLVSSISAYDPSPFAAIAVIEADDALNIALEHLTQHQRNHQTLQQLRECAEALDQRLKTNLKSLADIRNELIKSTPVSEPATDQKRSLLDADVLLNFAQLIARPANNANHGLAVQEDQRDMPAKSVEPDVKNEPGTPMLTDGLDLARGHAHLDEMLQDTAQAQNTSSTQDGRAVVSLDAAMRSWLEPIANPGSALPWMQEDEIRKSALGRLEEPE